MGGFYDVENTPKESYIKRITCNKKYYIQIILNIFSVNLLCRLVC